MKSGLMPGEWDLPPQYGPVFQDTSRQMKLADLLRQQSLEMPQGQMVSGIYVPPAITQYMAQALKGYNANKMEADAQSKQKAAYDDFQTKRTSATQALIDGLKTKTVDQPVDYSDAGGMPGMTEQVQQQPDFNAAFTSYLNSGVADPTMVAYVTGERNYQRGREDKLEDRQENRAAQAQARQEQREARMQELQLRMQDAATSRAEQAALRKELFQMQNDARRDMMVLSSANRPAPAASPVTVMRDGKPTIVDARTGRMIGEAPAAGNGKPDWKYDSGSDTWVAPPDANNPTGRRLPNQEKLNAQRSMEVVLKQFEGDVDESGKLIPGTGALGRTPQGGWMGISGKAGSVSNYQQKKRFDNLREQLSTELRTLFRIPGEGALSDKEQAQYGMQLPSTDYDEEINRQILADIRARVQARLGGGQQNIMPRNEQMPKGNSQPIIVDY